jgi:hypothetical protein
MGQADQRYRRRAHRMVMADRPRDAWRQAMKKQAALDARNRAALRRIVDRYGWPDQVLVGKRASRCAFLVLKHAPELAAEYLPLVAAAALRGMCPREDVAYLHDGVLTAAGRRQRYGTQLQLDPTTGRLEPFPIADARHVDRRRAAMSLPPLATYLREARATP